jgi:hypothetical protein
MIGVDNCDGQHTRRVTVAAMNPIDLIKEILATYEKHGWRLRRALLRPESRSGLNDESWVGDASIDPAELDALWFSRASQQNREAWELRLISATQYALFETFEADEPEAARDEVRREMEARMREKISSSEFQVPSKDLA